MANFPPLKAHILYCVDRAIERYRIQGPFLDGGCGSGDVSRHLARRGWKGKAVDLSQSAVERARTVLADFPAVSVENSSVLDVAGSGEFGAVLMMDVIEHIEDDRAVLRKAAELLGERGYLILSIPSNPREWRWDDDYYGHLRRYTRDEIDRKLREAGLRLIEAIDFTFPIFWAMRRLYTRLKSKPRIQGEAMERTLASSGQNAWEIPGLSALMSGGEIVWRVACSFQYRLFHPRVDLGHEMIVIARKEPRADLPVSAGFANVRGRGSA
jgi:SAM-dependent methyltransferase